MFLMLWLMTSQIIDIVSFSRFSVNRDERRITSIFLLEIFCFPQKSLKSSRNVSFSYCRNLVRFWDACRRLPLDVKLKRTLLSQLLLPKSFHFCEKCIHNNVKYHSQRSRLLISRGKLEKGFFVSSSFLVSLSSYKFYCFVYLCQMHPLEIVFS